MSGNLLIGIDVGTTSTKVLIADPVGQIVVEGVVGYPLFFPHTGWAEQSPGDILDGVKKALREALSQIPERVGEICALSFSTQRDTLIVTDADNVPLRNAITWLDSRSGEECDRMKQAFGEEKVYRITGVPISTIWTGAFLLWLREHEPVLWQRASCFGLVHDYLQCCFGADKHYLDSTNACQTMLYDFVHDCWNPELLSYVGVEEERLPQLVPPMTVLGTVCPALAEELGLPPGVLLIAGGGDQQCAMLGSGAVFPGDTEVCIGTAANILALLEAPKFDESRRLVCHRSLFEDRFVLEGAMLSTGKLIEWLADTLFPQEDEKEFYLKLNYEVAAGSHPGANGLLVTPHFEGAASPHWNHDARGIMLGLTLSTNRGEICRAVLEGIAMEIKKNLVLLREMGVESRRIIVSGGASNSPVWLQIIADVLGIEVITLENNNCAAMGSVILAGVGSGIFCSMEHGARNMVSVSKIYMPRAEYRQMYDELLQMNERCYHALDGNGLYQQNLQFKEKYIFEQDGDALQGEIKGV